MHHSLSKRLSTEWDHFISLSDQTRRVLLSYAFFLAAYPMIGIFTNAFLWRQTAEAAFLIVYNLGFFVGLPMGFFINGLLLRRFKITKLYFMGAVLQGLAPLLVMFAPAQKIEVLGAFGILFGLGAGLYWANKNYLCLKLTQGENRLYFNSIENIIGLAVGVAAPLLTGWLIITGSKFHLYSLDQGYQISMLLGIVLLTISGLLMLKSNIEQLEIKALLVDHPTKLWNLNRLYYIIYDTFIGIDHFVPSILVLLLVGNEAVLGSLQSVSAVLAAIVLYFVGRKLPLQKVVTALFICWLAYMVAGFSLAIAFNAVAVFVYLALISIFSVVRYSAGYSITMEVMDHEVGKRNEKNEYAYVSDNELFFNVGRVTGTTFFVMVMFLSSQTTALRYVPLTLTIIQGFAVLIMHTIARRIIRSKHLS